MTTSLGDNFETHIRDTYERSTHAREEQADFYADEIVTIADTEPDAAIARVRIDALAGQFARARLLQADALAATIARTREGFTG